MTHSTRCEDEALVMCRNGTTSQNAPSDDAVTPCAIRFSGDWKRSELPGMFERCEVYPGLINVPGTTLFGPGPSYCFQYSSLNGFTFGAVLYACSFSSSG